MKKFTFSFLLSSILILTTCVSFSQFKEPQALKRCGTMEALEQNLNDPAFRTQYEKGIKDYENSLTLRTGSTSRTTTLTAPVIIPVVVHVVISNPNLITEADIDYFLNRLNLDFSGLNPDSANGAPFYPVRGHSLLRFTRARRDPNGALTNGVERKAGSTLIAGNTYQPIKHASTATGGLDPWDVTKYYNLWVGDGGPAGLLGIAPAIGPGAQTETTTSSVGIDGVCVDYRGFSNSCFAYPAFNLARTAVHEIGHNFGLYHTFQGGCATTNDFGQLTTPSCQLPANLLGPSDDTPGQTGATSGCPTGNSAGGCTGTPLGKMYQNYMDYTDDPCYSMFTKGQVERMHWVTENCRAGYLTTNGGTPPAGTIALDAAPVDAVNPGGSEFNSVTCTSTSYANLTCPGTIAPKFRLVNRGTTTLTSIKVGFSLNGVVQENIITVNLPSGFTAVATFANVNVAAGSNTLKFWTALPNGSADQLPSNDTLTVTLLVGVGVTLPLTQDFSSLTFPPPGWSLVKVAGTSTTAAWIRNNATNGGAAGSAMANFWTIGSGNVIDLRTPIVSSALADSMTISFDVAHRQYNAVQDTLQLFVSTNCGSTFTKLFERWSSQLTVQASSAAEYTTPLATDWRNYKVTLPSAAAPNILTNPNLQFAFRASSRFGNNIFLDNVNITKVSLVRRDITPVAFTEPFTTLCDGNNVKPAVQIKNQGIDTVKTFTVNYTVNGTAQTSINFTGTLAKNDVTLVQLNTANFTPGIYNIKAWTSNPNGLADQLPTNDTILYTFQVVATVDAPLVEGFESTTFPPANWQISQQPVDTTIWRRTILAGKNSVASANMNNFKSPFKGRIDDLITPVVKYSGADSVFLRFDVAASTYSFPGSTALPLDTLEILTTKDCGKTYTSVYKKYGSDLQTVNDVNTPYTTAFVPRNDQWRSDSVNVTGLLGAASSVRFAFRNTGNSENNIYLDNINFTPKTLPAKLKQNGFLISPNPFRNMFTIQQYQTAADLRGYGVYNSIGQRVLGQSYGEGMAGNSIQVNMSYLPAGMYTVKLVYTGKTVSQKIIKLN